MARARSIREVRLGDLDSRLNALDGPELERALRSLARDPRAGARAVAARWRRRLDAAAAEERRVEELFRFEWSLRDQGYAVIAGVDEVGRGALAGPLIAAAVVLPDGAQAGLEGLKDSKLLDAGRRETLAGALRACAIAWSVGRAEPEEIDRVGIQHANMAAMRRALDGLGVACDYVLADAFELKGLDMPCLGLVRGDKRSASIAAASIVAKVTRDEFMVSLGARYPGYGFEHHVGYGCAEHFAALDRLGPCPAHRRSFAPVATRLMGRLDLA